MTAACPEPVEGVVVIEHKQPVPAQAGIIKTADHIIDLGPDGGVRGGEIVAESKTAKGQRTPEDVAQEPRSYTGQYLKPMLERAGAAREAAE